MKETSSWSGSYLSPQYYRDRGDVSILGFKEEVISARRQFLYRLICFSQVSLEKGGRGGVGGVTCKSSELEIETRERSGPTET
jgi:hypothetical protein